MTDTNPVAPTENESASTPPVTSREGAWADIVKPTDRELPQATYPRSPSREQGGSQWSPIPGSIERRYKFVRPLNAHGGEGNLYVVFDRELDCEVVFKLYMTGIALVRGALEMVQSIASEHVVTLYDFGIVEETGQWYEVQELITGGDLLSLQKGTLFDRAKKDTAGSVDQNLRLAVAELTQAITAFHSAGLSHHDIKPSNILVRTTDPLDLVLADFGLSIAADRTTFLSRRGGTIAYDSPEALGALQGGPKRDFWALGMTLAQLAAGRHPFALPGPREEMLDDATIRAHLFARNPIDLSGIVDPEVSRLCAGLTRYNAVNRWGQAELSDWLKGGKPAVIPDPVAAEVTPDGVPFGGRICASRAELARAMAADWRAAAGRLNTAQRRAELVDEIGGAMGSAGLAELEASWLQTEPGIDRAVADFIVALDPEGAPVAVHGFRVDQAHLAGLARSTAEGDAVAARAVDALFSQECLRAFAAMPGHESLATLDASWRDAVEEFEQHLETAAKAGARVEARPAEVRSQILAALADPDFAQDLLTARGPTRADAARQSWFSDLMAPAPNDPAAVLASTLLAGEAVRMTTEQVARDRAEKERARTEREQDRSARRKARAQAEAAAWAKDVRTFRRTFVVCITALIPVTFGFLAVLADFHPLGFTRPRGPRFQELGVLVEARWTAVALYLWAVGVGVVGLLGAARLTLRFPWSLRPRGLFLAATLALVAGLTLVGHDAVGARLLAPAREALTTTPISLNQIEDACRNLNYWTRSDSPVRAVITGAECNAISSYDGWRRSWLHFVPATPVSVFTSMNDAYITASGNGSQHLEAVDGITGALLWQKHCETGWSVDTSQQDDYENTPAEQRVGVTCDGNQAWLDPRTGG